MKRDILRIDEQLCNGCGLCVPSCHEGALQIVDGKARLVSELMCDGLGACIGHCPEGAITIETTEAEPYSETKVIEQMNNRSGCPGSREIVIEKQGQPENQVASADQPSELRQWPIQMHLVNPNAPYFRDADLILAADCVAFSMGNFHSRYLKGKSLAIACPKLDQGLDIYIGKLTALIDTAKVNTITVMMMEVPCCSGLLQMVKTAMSKASRKVPVKMMVTGINGSILKEEWI
ncbi:MAG: 4Fe-4S binding protein [Bacteroidales bacterium]|jgi:NAD-dependent dihydropyrimidine dehydrogenase PreA subunit|nr:4Fe-4S binding protein [Bacteroidales bacterium]